MVTEEVCIKSALGFISEEAVRLEEMSKYLLCRCSISKDLQWSDECFVKVMMGGIRC